MKKMTAKERREQEKQKRAEVIRGKQEANRKKPKLLPHRMPQLLYTIKMPNPWQRPPD